MVIGSFRDAVGRPATTHINPHQIQKFVHIKNTYSLGIKPAPIGEKDTLPTYHYTTTFIHINLHLRIDVI